jgi:hypothetical protein
MSTSRRYQLRLPPAFATELEAFAQTRGLALGAAMRLLVARGLEAEAPLPGSHSAHSESPATLAALTAAELAVLMVASILPEGEHRMRSLAERAFQAAEERLAMFSKQPVGLDQ